MFERDVGGGFVKAHLAGLIAVVLAAGSVVQAAAQTVPTPRPAPRGLAADVAGATMLATFTAGAGRVSDLERTVFGPSLPPNLAIKRELTVDVSRAVAEFYASRDYRPLWSPAAEAKVLDRLADAAGDGLDPADYRLSPTLDGAARDVTLTELVLAYARDAHSGRVVPTSVSRIITAEPPQLDATRFLTRIGVGVDPIKVLESAHPQHPQYQALREALRAALGTTVIVQPRVGPGPNLKRGDRAPRVAVLRARLGATVRRGTDPTVFDEPLRAAVKAFQRENRLGADGIVGPRTLAALDGAVEGDPVPALISNMERWRWLPRRLGTHHVRVNIPAYRVRIRSHGERIYDGRVIVGKPGNPTPVFSDEMDHLVVNPYWNVPYSIAKNEMLGGIRANPSGYFARRGYEVVKNGRVVNPASISWNEATLRRVRVRQRPGRGNALGAVKFMFPNQHAVYLHDTPTKHLFKRERRAFSHGCVRVHNPFQFADALLSVDEALSGKGLQRMVGGRERRVNLATPIPVHLTYFTREVREDGTLARYADIYGYDARTRRALGL